MPLSDKQQGPEPKAKSYFIVVLTVAALAFLIFRPSLDQDKQQGEDDKNAEEIAANGNKAVPNSNKVDSKTPSRISKKETDKDSPAVARKQPSAGQTEKAKSNSSTVRRKKTSSSSASPRGPPKNDAKNVNDPWAVLKKIGSDKYESPAGLIYGRGSVDGHRLKHVMQHAKDNPSKPIHGVFDGSPVSIIKLVDEAYMRIKKKDRSVSKSPSGKRVAYTVSFGKRIGYVGGQAGKRKNFPAAKSLALVLEADRVITAYPK